MAKKKTTAVTRFDGSAILVTGDRLMTFLTFHDMDRYIRDNDVKVDITHWHPASGLRRGGEDDEEMPSVRN